MPTRRSEPRKSVRAVGSPALGAGCRDGAARESRGPSTSGRALRSLDAADVDPERAPAGRRGRRRGTSRARSPSGCRTRSPSLGRRRRRATKPGGDRVAEGSRGRRGGRSRLRRLRTRQRSSSSSEKTGRTANPRPARSERMSNWRADAVSAVVRARPDAETGTGRLRRRRRKPEFPDPGGPGAVPSSGKLDPERSPGDRL